MVSGLRIENALPEFLESLREWREPPTASDVARSRYFERIAPLAGQVFGDAEDIHAMTSEFSPAEWRAYRDHALTLDPEKLEARLRRAQSSVEQALGTTLGGSVLLFSAFHAMDGYARYGDGGRHVVFLGVDESFDRPHYLDVLMVHELTHVARESQASVWSGLGLEVPRTNAEFTDRQPVIEHLFGEGFSCALSERLVPLGSPPEPWNYAYQTQGSYERILAHASSVDARVHAELRSPDGDYGALYSPSGYSPRLPAFSHYVWAWKWVSKIIEEFGGGDPSKVLARSSAEFLEHALQFKL